jgi:hypothetical protein
LEDFKFLYSVGQLAQSAIFENLSVSNITPKGAIVPNDLLYKFANKQKLSRSRNIYFKGPNNVIQLLGFSELVCVCQLDHSAKFIDHHEEFLIQI